MPTSETQQDIFLHQVDAYIKVHEREAKDHSAHMYFLHILRKGLETRIQGNYGIAAAYIVRHGGVEIVFFGQNSLITEGNPHGHAEMNATKNAVQLLQVPSEKRTAYLLDQQSKGNILVQRAPHEHSETILYTSLEPCPMCTVGAVINSGIEKVVIGTEDPYAGQLAESRLSSLSPLWKQMADIQGLQVSFSQSTNPNQIDTYVPSELRTILNDLFFQTKEPLDAKLAENAFLDVQQIGLIASGLLGSLK